MALSPDHKLAQVSGWQMGVLFESDLFEEVFIAIDESGPTGTAAAMLAMWSTLQGSVVRCRSILAKPLKITRGSGLASLSRCSTGWRATA